MHTRGRDALSNDTQQCRGTAEALDDQVAFQVAFQVSLTSYTRHLVLQDGHKSIEQAMYNRFLEQHMHTYLSMEHANAAVKVHVFDVSEGTNGEAGETDNAGSPTSMKPKPRPNRPSIASAFLSKPAARPAIHNPSIS